MTTLNAGTLGLGARQRMPGRDALALRQREKRMPAAWMMLLERRCYGLGAPRQAVTLNERYPVCPASTRTVAHSALIVAEHIADDCMTAGLYRRLLAATNGGEWLIARKTIEQLVAYLLERNLAPSAARNALVDLAVSLPAEERRDTAWAIVKYLEGQPKSRIVTFKLNEMKSRPPSTPDAIFEPWSSPTIIPRDYLPRICGKKREGFE